MPGLADPAAERFLLAGIFAGGQEAFLDVADIVGPDSFVVDSNAHLFRCLDVLLRQPGRAADLPGIHEAASSCGLGGYFLQRDEAKHLRAVMGAATAVADGPQTARRNAAKVRKLHIARQLDAALAQARQSLGGLTGDEDPSEILARAEGPIFDFTCRLADTGSRGVVPMGEGAEEYFAHLMDNPRACVGVPTGFPNFDNVLGGGLRAGGVDLVGARQGEGKSFLAGNVSMNIARPPVSVPVLDVDTEMAHREHQVRLGACMAGLDLRKIEQGAYGGDASLRARLGEAGRELRGLPYDYLEARDMSFEDVLAHMRRWVIRKVGLGEDGKAKPCVVIYDWLRLNSASSISRNIMEYQQLGFIASGLKNFMGHYGVSCLCFTQLNREGIDAEDGSVIRGSDRILDFVTSFTIFKKKSDDERAADLGNGSTEFTHKFIPLKLRFGSTISRGDYINLKADYAKGLIKEGPMARAGLKKKKGVGRDIPAGG